MTAWTEEMGARMKELYVRGDSHTDIAKVLNREFRISLNRNSIIGRAHRIGLDKRKNSGSFQNRSVKKPDPPRPLTWTTPPINAVPIICRDASEVVPLHVELKDLSTEACRWPYGDKVPFSFCGHPKASRWYCAAHQELSTR